MILPTAAEEQKYLSKVCGNEKKHLPLQPQKQMDGEVAQLVRASDS
jgi:hypothetical protein